MRICAVLSQKQATTNEQLVKYEAALRAQYGSLDALLVKMNNSASALTALQIKMTECDFSRTHICITVI